jgi:hypothetical protein
MARWNAHHHLNLISIYESGMLYLAIVMVLIKSKKMVSDQEKLYWVREEK